MAFIRQLTKQYKIEQGRIKQKTAREAYSGDEKIALLNLAEQYLVKTLEGIYNNENLADMKSSEDFVNSLLQDGAPSELLVCASAAKTFETLVHEELEEALGVAEIESLFQKKITEMCAEHLTDINTVFAYGCRMLANTKDEKNKAMWRKSLAALMRCDIDPTAKISTQSGVFKEEELDAFEFSDQNLQEENVLIYEMYLLIKQKYHKQIEAKKVNHLEAKNDADSSDDENEKNQSFDIKDIIRQSKIVMAKTLHAIISAKDNPVNLNEYKLEITTLLDRILNQLISEKHYYTGCLASTPFNWLAELDPEKVGEFLTEHTKEIATKLIAKNDFASLNNIKKFFKNNEITTAIFGALFDNAENKPLISNPLFTTLRNENEECFREFLRDDGISKLLGNDDFETLQYFYSNHIEEEQIFERALNKVGNSSEEKPLAENKYFQFCVKAQPEKVNLYLEQNGQRIFERLAKSNDLTTLEYYLQNKIGVDELVRACLNVIFSSSTDRSVTQHPLFLFLDKQVNLVEHLKKHSALVCDRLATTSDMEMTEFALKNQIDTSELAKKIVAHSSIRWKGSYTNPLIKNPKIQLLQLHCTKELNTALSSPNIVASLIGLDDFETLEYIARNSKEVNADLLVRDSMTRLFLKGKPITEDPLFKLLLEHYGDALKKYLSQNAVSFFDLFLRNGDANSLNCMLENSLINLFQELRNKEFSQYSLTEFSNEDRWCKEGMMTTFFKIDTKHLVMQMRLLLNFVLKQTTYSGEDYFVIAHKFDLDYKGQKYQLPHVIYDIAKIMIDVIKMHEDVKAEPQPKVITGEFLKLIAKARQHAPKEHEKGYKSNASKVLNGIACKGTENPVMKFINTMLFDQDKRCQLLEGEAPTKVDALPKSPSNRFFSAANNVGVPVVEEKENKLQATMW